MSEEAERVTTIWSVALLGTKDTDAGISIISTLAISALSEQDALGVCMQRLQELYPGHTIGKHVSTKAEIVAKAGEA